MMILGVCDVCHCNHEEEVDQFGTDNYFCCACLCHEHEDWYVPLSDDEEPDNSDAYDDEEEHDFIVAISNAYQFEGDDEEGTVVHGYNDYDSPEYDVE